MKSTNLVFAVTDAKTFFVCVYWDFNSRPCAGQALYHLSHLTSQMQKLSKFVPGLQGSTSSSGINRILL
jgi:hypothetical protein